MTFNIIKVLLVVDVRRILFFDFFRSRIFMGMQDPSACGSKKHRGLRSLVFGTMVAGLDLHGYTFESS